jgi:thymidylate synthase (FAD)
MKLIRQYWEFEDNFNPKTILQKLEKAGRVCYKSEGSSSENSYGEFLSRRIKTGHESLLEHSSITVKIVTDRGVTHELVRHRIASYSQESTRYCNYNKMGITFIIPEDFTIDNAGMELLHSIETYYNDCIKKGMTPQQARYFLPNGLKTEIITTMNIREWRHFFNLRCSKAAHPQMRALALDMLSKFYEKLPVLFEDIYIKYQIGG